MKNKELWIMSALAVLTVGYAMAQNRKETPTDPTDPPNPTDTGVDNQRPDKRVHVAFFNKSFGNIRNAGKIKYAGEITPKQNTYKKFSAWKYGAAAMIAHLQRYISGTFCRDNKGIKNCTGKLNTIEKILYVYAPPTENDTEAYIKFVAKDTGFTRSQILDHTNKTTMWKLTKAMSKMESSQATVHYTEGVFTEGWEIAKTQNT